MRVRILVLLLGGLLIGVGLATIVYFSSNGFAGLSSPSAPLVGNRSPDFKLASLQGGNVTLNQFHGKVVIINFWATWCPPCKEEMPLLRAYADSHADDTVLLGINFDEQAYVVQEFITGQNLTFPILLDPGGKVSDLYRIRAYPTTFFVDAEGKIRAYHVGLLSKELVDMYYRSAGGTP